MVNWHERALELEKQGLTAMDLFENNNTTPFEAYKQLLEIAEKDIISAFKNEIKKDGFVELNKIYPVYLRASQAEIEREKKK